MFCDIAILSWILIIELFLPTAGEGNFFTRVCLYTRGGCYGVCLLRGWLCLLGGMPTWAYWEVCLLGVCAAYWNVCRLQGCVPTRGIRDVLVFRNVHTFRAIFTGRNEVLAKVIFLHLFVILFTGGGCLARRTPPGQVPPRTRYPPGPGTPPSPDQVPSPRSSKLRNTVNDRPVRILLECILVNGCYGWKGVSLFFCFDKTSHSLVQRTKTKSLIGQ